MKVLTTEQIRRADEYTIQHEPIRSADLMERAASSLAAWLLKQYHGPANFRIFAGFGNNGGDGIALARMLAEAGKRVYLHVVESPRGLSPDAQEHLNHLDQSSLMEFSRIRSVEDLPVISDHDQVIDALFGSGLSKEPDGLIAACITHINQSPANVIAIDIPSGLFGEDNRHNSLNYTVKANVTLSLQAPNLSLFMPENEQFVGEWHVIPIGLHPGFFEAAETPYHYITEEDCHSWLMAREKFDHKGKFGHALLFCGSKGKTGAAILAAKACLRSGCGLATVCVPDASDPIVQSAVPEAMTIADPDPLKWTTVPDLAPFDSIGVGPGIGTDEKTSEALLKLFCSCPNPIVADADALNLMARNPEILSRIPKNSILTPHPGEFRRLFGDDPDGYTRMEHLRGLSSSLGLVIVLKGAHTAVAGTDGSVWLNTSGNPGMATGGSGDVLTGMITSLLAQGYDPFTAARLGVCLHGIAGDIASVQYGQEALVAGDIINSIGQAFKRIKSV